MVVEQQDFRCIFTRSFPRVDDVIMFYICRENGVNVLCKKLSFLFPFASIDSIFFVDPLPHYLHNATIKYRTA